MASLRVVIIEDSKAIRMRLVALVEELGDTVVVGEAETELEAIRLCTEKAPDVVILDMQLADGSGLGMMKVMQFNRAISKPTIIVLTNFPSPSVQRAAISLGADHFLDKSLEFNKLPALLRYAAEAIRLNANDTVLVKKI
jgi:two-component system, OmpR family, response regulator